MENIYNHSTKLFGSREPEIQQKTNINSIAVVGNKTVEYHKTLRVGNKQTNQLRTAEKKRKRMGEYQKEEGNKMWHDSRVNDD